MSDDQAVNPPKPSSSMEIEQLAYLGSFDAVVDRLYAHVAYKETRVSSGKWVVRIKSSVTAGCVFDPDNASLKNALRKAAAHDESYVVWGFNLDAKNERDPRLVENRILIDGDGTPTAVEMHLVTRKADHSAMEEKVATFAWPGA